jgi:hypothetical protein
MFVPIPRVLENSSVPSTLPAIAIRLDHLVDRLKMAYRAFQGEVYYMLIARILHACIIILLWLW